MNIQNDHFSNEDDARAEIEAAGFWPIMIEFPPEKNDDHWHDFDSMLYVLEGELTVHEAESGETCVCGPGTRIVAKAGVLHHEEHSGYKALIGLSIEPAKLSQPLNKPPPVRLP